MSAPKEIWIAMSESDTGVVLGFARKVRGYPHRYIRADLTCGECRLQNEHLALSCACNRYSGNMVNARPACMAFVPGEGER